MSTMLSSVVGARSLGGGLGVPRPDLRGPLAAMLAAAMTLSIAVVVDTGLGETDDSAAAGAAGAAAIAAGSQTVRPGEVPEGLTAAEWTSIQEQIAATRAGAVTRPVEFAPVPPAVAPAVAAPSAGAPRLATGRVAGTFLPGLAVVRAGTADVNFATASVGDVALGGVAGRAVGDRVEYAHAGGITEWYREVADGLQQGFTLSEPVTNSTDTVVTIGVSPGRPVLVDDRTIHIERPGLQPIVYRDLVAWDANRAPLATAMSVVDGAIVLTVTTEGATYPVTIDPIITEDEAILGLENASGDQSGFAVAIDEDTVIVSSPFDDDTGDDRGKVEVWNYDVGTGGVALFQSWYGGVNGDSDYGYSVDVEGDLFVVGAPGDSANGADAGAVHIYTRGFPGDPWGVKGVIYACDIVGCDHGVTGAGSPGDRFGESVAIVDDQSRIVVGAPGHNSGAGRAYSIDIDSSATLDQALDGSHPSVGGFGTSVDISSDGSLIGVGAPLTDFSGVSDSGVAYVFTETAGAYNETRELNPQTYGTQIGGNFGDSVAIESSLPTYLVATEPGAGTFFVHDIADILSFGQDLTNVLQFGGFDTSVSAEGDDVVAGKPLASDGDGELSVLTRTPSPFAFSERVVTPSLPLGEAGSAAGSSVSIGSSGSVVYGLPLFDNAPDGTATGPNQIDRGQARVWDDVSLVSPTESTIFSRGSLARDEFGYVVDIDGDRMAVSSPYADEPDRNSGAVNILERTGPGAPWNLVAVVRSPSPEVDGHFGESLDLFGDRLAVGEPDSLGDEAEPGRVWAFERQGSGAWTQLGTEITRTGGGTAGDEFGYSVAFVDTDRLVIGSPGEAVDAGAVYATAYTSAWAVPVVLTTGTPLTGDRIGHSVAAATGASGTFAVAGAPGDDADPGDDAGAIYIWEDTGGGFGVSTPVQKIDQSGGGWLDFDGVGSAVNTDGLRIVAAGLGDFTAGQAFTAHAFDVVALGSPNTWGPVWEFRGTVPVTLNQPVNDYVDIDGGNIALGRPGGGGQVGVFWYDGTTWPASPDDQFVPTGTAVGDRVGSTVAIEGRTLVTGASGDDRPGEVDVGRVFEINDLKISHEYIAAFPLTDPSAWDTGVVPGPGDTAVIPNGLIDPLNVGGTFDVGRLALGVGSIVRVLPGQTLSMSGVSSGAPSTIDGDIENLSSTTLDISTDVVIGPSGEIVTEVGGVTNLNAVSNSIFISGDGIFEVRGTLNKNGVNDAVIDRDVAYLTSSAGTSTTNIDDGRLEIGGPFDEYGQVFLAPDTDLTYLDIVQLEPFGFISIGPGATLSPQESFAAFGGAGITIQIDGPPPGNVGSIAPAFATPDLGTSTLTAEVLGYVPVEGDTYTFLSCYDECASAVGGVIPEIEPFEIGFIDFGPGLGEDAVFFVPVTTHTWVGGFGNDFGNPLNWDTGIVPGVGDTAIVPSGFGATIDVTATHEIAALTVDSGSTVTVTPTGDLTITGNTGVPSTVDGDLAVDVGGRLELRTDVELVGAGDDITVDGELVLAADVLTSITGGGRIFVDGSLTKEGFGEYFVDVDVNVGEGATIALASGGGQLTFDDFGTWDSGDGVITLETPSGTTMELNGNHTWSGTIVGTSATVTPGTVLVTGIRNWAAPTGTSPNRLSFLRDTGDPDNAALWQLQIDGAAFTGQPFAIDEVARIAGGATPISAELSVASSATLAVEANILGNGDIVNGGTVIASAASFGGVLNSFTNDGLFQADRSGSFMTIGLSWVSTPTSVIEFLPNSATTMTAAGYTSELGTVRVFPGAWVRNSGSVSYDAGAEVEFEITGPGQFGYVEHLAAVPILDPGTTLRTTGGYTPVGGDAFDIWRCNGGTCPLFTTTDIAGYQQNQVGDDVSLGVAPAGPITVDTLDGLGLADGLCSLREAIIAANTDAANDGCPAGSGADTIEFGVSGTIPLTTRLPDITSEITIDGTGQDVTVSGQNSTPVLFVDGSGTAGLSDLTIADGERQNCSGGDGCGAVLNEGTLVVTDSTFSGNNSNNGNGAAITNDLEGWVVISNSTFTGNTTTFGGGAIWNKNGGVDITNSTFVGNSSGNGGAVYNFLVPATITITNSTFAGNNASNAIVQNANPDPGSAVLRNTIIDGGAGTACSGLIDADLFNIDTDGTCGSAGTTTSFALDLAPLADNGGPTATVALGPASAAIDAGDPTVCSAAPVDGVDQRGVAREATGCDVGAFEVPTHVVDDTGDAGDFDTGDLVCETGPGNGVCTLRAAIEQANSSAGFDRIHFDIPGPGPHTIAPLSSMTSVTGLVVIDGYTQPGASPNTLAVGSDAVLQIVIDGTSAGGSVLDLAPSAGGSVVRGLVVNGASGFEAAAIRVATSSTIEGNRIGTNAAGSAAAALPNYYGILVDGASSVVIGGSTPAQRNLISGNTNDGIYIDDGASSSTDVTVLGNYIGTDASGTSAVPNLSGVCACSFTGGPTTISDNLLSGNSAAGVFIASADTAILGNLIGTDVTGLSALPNGRGGVVSGFGSVRSVIGDGTPAGRNVISGNENEGGVSLGSGTEDGTVVRGNYIGVGIDGTTPIGNSRGVWVFSSGATNVAIGGEGVGNVIASNVGQGVLLSAGTGTRVVDNTISGNGGPGLEIVGAGANDPGDADTGPNNLQNYPELTASIDGGDLIVEYSIDSTIANSAYPIQIDVYEADSPASGEGDRFLGRTTIPAPGADTLVLDATALGVTSGDSLVATATDADGNTSIFSPVATVAEAGPENRVLDFDGVGDTRFGAALAMDGDLAVVGKPHTGAGSTGVVLVRRNTDGSWSSFSQLAFSAGGGIVVGSDVALSGDNAAWVIDGFGVTVHRIDRGVPSFGISEATGLVPAATSVDLDGDRMIIGAASSGEFWIYERTGSGPGAWTVALGPVAGAAGTFGFDVAISGDVAVVSDTSNLIDGTVSVYERTGSGWSATATDVLSNPDSATTGDDWFGSSVDIDGNTLVVGHSLNNDPAGDEGAVWVYEGAPGTFGSATPVKLSASEIGTGDVFGQQVSVDGDFIVVGAPAHNEFNVPFRSGGAFVFARDGGDWIQIDFLLAEDRASDDRFGDAVGVADVGGAARVLIAAPFDDNPNGTDAGAVYSFAVQAPQPGRTTSPSPVDDGLFGFDVDVDGGTAIIGVPGGAGLPGTAWLATQGSDGTWRLADELPNPGATPNDGYGVGVAIDGDVAVIGDGEQFHFYSSSDDEWNYRNSFVNPDPVGAFPLFGEYLDFDGTTLVVSAHGSDVEGVGGINAGGFYIFEKTGFSTFTDVGGGFVQPAGAEAGDLISRGAVAVDGGVIAVGAQNDDDAGGDAGAVYVYRRTGPSTWTFEQKLLGPSAGDQFGSSVALSGGRLVVGAAVGEASGSALGQVHVFRDDGSWTEEAVLTSSNIVFTGAGGAGLGASVDIDGSVVVAGAPLDDTPTNDTGAVATWVLIQDRWVESTTYRAADAETPDQLGSAVAVAGTAVIAGAPADDNGGRTDAGATYGFTVGVPNQIISPEPATGEEFGYALDHDDDVLVAGAWRNADAGADAGTAYAFLRQPDGSWLFDQELRPATLSAGDDYATILDVASNGTGDHLVAIGAPGDGDGAVYLWKYDGATWTEITPALTGPAGATYFGGALDVEHAFGTTFTVVVGAPDDGNALDGGPGVVTVSSVDVSGSIVEALATIDGSDSSIASTETAGTAHAAFGSIVAISGDTLAVGAFGNDGPDGQPNTNDIGAISVFRATDSTLTTWFEEAVLTPCSVEAGGAGAATLCSDELGINLGFDIDLDGDTLAAGAVGDGGEVFVYNRVGTTWFASERLASGSTSEFPLFGIAVDLEDDLLLAGASFGGDDEQGEAVVFRRVDGSWTDEAVLTGAGTESDDQVGVYASLDEDGSIVLGSRFPTAAGIDDAGAAYAFDVTPSGKLIGVDARTEFGHRVDVDGDWGVIAQRNGGSSPTSIFVVERDPAAGDWSIAQTFDFDTPPFSAGIADVAIGGNVFAAVAETGELVAWSRLTEANPFGPVAIAPGLASMRSVDVLDNDIVAAGPLGFSLWTNPIVSGSVFNSTLPGSPDFGAAVALGADKIVVAETNLAASPGVVYTYDRVPGAPGPFSSALGPIDILNPPADAAGDAFFGSSLAVEGGTLVIGQSLEDNDATDPRGVQPDAGAVWVYAGDNGAWGAPQKLVPADSDAANQFGSAVAIDGSTIAVGASAAAELGVGERTGAVYTFADLGGAWTENGRRSAGDGENGDQLGSTLALSGGQILAGAPGDDNANGLDAGAVYTFGVPAPAEIPTITLDIDAVSGSSVVVAANGLSVADFSATVIEDNATNETSIAAAPLAGIELEDTPLAGIAVADTPLAGIVLDSTPLAGIPLIDVDVDGGWTTLLENTELENVPLVDLTFGDALEDPDVLPKVQSLPLAGIDVDGTPLAGIPLAGIALGDTPLAGIPLAGIGQDWCSIVTQFLTDVTCTTEADLVDITLMEATLRGVPLAGIPLADIPLAGIDLVDTPLAGIPLAGIEFQATPLAGIPLAGIDVSNTPLAGIPLAGIGPEGLPLAGIPLAGIDVQGSPLAGIPLAGIPLAGIATSIPLAGIPLAGIDVAGAPLAGIPLAGILLMDAPLAGIPLAGIDATAAENEAAWCDLLAGTGAIDCDGGVDPTTTTLFDISAQGTPLAGIPLAGIDLTDAPLAGIELATAPLAGIPLEGVPLAGIPLAGIELDGTPLAGISLAGIPLAGIDLERSPLAGIPLAGIDVATSPLAGILLADIPLAGIPLAGAPLAGIPLAGIDLTGTPLAGIGDLAAVPLAGIDVIDSPLAGIPLAGIELAGIPLAGIGVDCDTGAVNCELDSLGDAVKAGAIDLDTTLGELQDALAGLSLGGLAPHLLGLDADQLRSVLDAAGLTLADLAVLDDLTLGDLPAGDPLFEQVTLGDLEAQLVNVTFADLIGALLDPVTGAPIDAALLDAALRAAIDELDLTIGDLTVGGEVTLGDLIGGAAGTTFFLDDLGRILGLISVQSVLDATGGTAGALTGSLADLTDDERGDMTLADLVGADEFGVIDTVALLEILEAQGLLGDFTVGDLLLGLVGADQLPFGGFDFTDVEVGNLPSNTVADVTFAATFAVADTTAEQTVEVATTLPSTAAYIAGTSTVAVSGGTPAPIAAEVDGNTLTWRIDAVVPGDSYAISFDVRPEIDLGASILNGSARVIGAEATATSFGSVQVLEGLEPNDFVDGVTDVQADTIYLTYVSDATDIDVFAITLQDNDVLAVELSNLAADFDVALYVDPADQAVGSALSGTSDNAPIFPITDPDQAGADAEPLDDFTRLDLIDPNLDLLEVSNARGLDNELIVTDLLPAGTYYVQVFGANGVSSPTPAALQIQVDEAETRPPCAVVDPITALAGTTDTVTASTNTLFLVNEQRLEAFHGAAGRTAVIDELLGVDGLVPFLQANPQFGLDPAVVAVDGNGVVQAAYDTWNGVDDPEDACDPNAANGVVEAINTQIIDPIRDQLDYIVVIGGDEQIPMARLEDATTVANEYDYRHEFDGDLAGSDPDGANAFTASFWERHYLSDEPYGETAAQSLGNRYLYVSDIALGRLVDTPDQIVEALDDFVVHQGSLDIGSAAVLGYDFLVDGSEEIAAEFADTQAVALDDELADGIDDVADGGDGEAWDRADAEDKLGVVDRQNPALNAFNNALISLNAHFDHYRALPAAGDKEPGFTDNLIAADVADLLGVDGLDQSLIFTMGCHSGLATPDALIARTNDDWAERVAGIGGILIANTGFGYGDTEAVAYTERLMALFAEQVTAPIEVDGLPTTVGEALVFAKNQYVAELALLSVYDEKAVMESTFYGLPFYRTALPTAAAPPIPVNVPVPDSSGDPAVTYTVEPTNQQNDTDRGIYFANLDADGDELTIVAPGRPIQPADVVDVSVVDQTDTTRLAELARGAIVLDMTSQWFLLPNPVVATPIFDESASQLEPDIGEQTFPAKPVTINTSRTPSGERQSLVVATGQYRSETETQRLDSDLDVVVYYSPAGVGDLVAPTIRSVTSTVENGQVTITATVTDGSGVDRVYVLLAEDPGGAATVNWRGLDLINPGGGDQWSGSLQLAAGTTDLEFLVQAKDATGNVGYATNKAANFGDDTTPPPPPPPTPDLDVDPDATNLDPTSGWYTGDVTITVDSGELDAEFSVDGAPFLPVPRSGPDAGTFVITGDGIHTWIVVTSNDQTQSGTVRIDTTGEPTIDLGTPDVGGTYEVGTASLDLLCVDPSLTSCLITIDGVPFEVGDRLDQVPGSYTMTVTAVDVFDNVATETVPFTITAPVSAEPVVVEVVGPTTPQLISDGVSIEIEFDDGDGSFDDYTVTIDWGDGDPDNSIAATTCEASSGAPQGGNPSCEIVTEPGTGNAGLAIGDFVYDEPGVYAITVTVTDAAGNTDTETYEFAVVYDPGAGRVSGAGWYWSGNEAYDDGRPWGNLARFGYRARYKAGDDVPSGKTKLHLIGEFFFKSVSYDYLIVNDTVAVAEGVGKLNGQTGYRFRVQGIDNGWIDFFQISVWDEATGETIYDNGVLYDEGDLVLLGGIRVRS